MVKSQAKYCIIVAGGSGIRMGAALPKQFIEINGKPVLMHTIEKFYRFDSDMEIIVVLPKDQQEPWSQLCEKYGFIISHQVVNGGITRFHSVKNALKMVGNEGLIAVHDGVRPLVSLDTISRCFEEASQKGNAIPTIPINDSVRFVDGENSKAVDRKSYRLIQTPQVFRAELLHKAYESGYRPEFTDDASVIEYIGESVFLADGNSENIKLTYPSDIIMARTLLTAEISKKQ